MNEEISIISNKRMMMNDVNNKNVKSKDFGKAPTFLHLYLYLAVMGLLSLIWLLNVIRVGLSFFWPMFPMFGWGFACGYNIILYLSYNDKNQFLSKIRNKPYFGPLFITHAWFYISISTFLVVLNVLYSRFPWSAFAIIGWGMAFGAHLILAYSLASTLEKSNLSERDNNELMKRQDQVGKSTYCHSCGADISNRPNANYCSFCGSKIED